MDMLDHPQAGKSVRIDWDGGQGVFFRNGVKTYTFSESEWNLEKRIPAMDEEGFDVQVLIPENRPLIYEVDPDLGCALARAYNDATAEVCRGQGRFLGVAWVYLPEVQEATKELERAVTKLGLQAVKVVGGFDDVNLGSKLLDPFYGKAAELNVPVLVHPTARNHDNSDFNPILVGADKFGAEYGFLGGGALGFTFTSILTITQLIFGGMMDRFPNLKVGFFESGAGWIPFLANRLDIYCEAERRQGRASDAEYPKETPSAYFDRLYVAAMSRESYLADTVRNLPNHRIIIGSDFPHNDPNATWPHTTSEMRAIDDLPEADLERILDTNPRELFGL
jgi:aminocarboxymuconate-semialdehyde decarboxylase